MRVVSVALVIEPLHRVDAPGAAWLDVEIHDHVGSQAWFFGHCMDSLTGFGVPDPLLAMSPPPSFQLFGLDHLVVIGMTVAIAAALVFLARRHGEGHVVVRRSVKVLAWLLFLSFPLKFMAFYFSGAPMHEHGLPMHLCNWAAIIGGLALLTKRQLFCELLYFWGLAATLQAVITPNLPYGFPHAIFFTFFITHSGVVIAAIVVAFGLRRSPAPGGVWRAIFWLQAYLVVAVIVNSLTGANYGFLREKPAMGSLIDHLGDWPYYIIGLEAVALISFLLLNFPFVRRNHVK